MFPWFSPCHYLVVHRCTSCQGRLPFLWIFDGVRNNHIQNQGFVHLIFAFVKYSSTTKYENNTGIGFCLCPIYSKFTLGICVMRPWHWRDVGNYRLLLPTDASKHTLSMLKSVKCYPGGRQIRFNIWDTVTRVVPLCSVYQAPSYESNLKLLAWCLPEFAYLSMLFILETVCTAVRTISRINSMLK